MRINTSCFFAFLLILMLSCYSPTAQLYPTANISTAWTANNQFSGQTILIRETNVARFTCGFFYEGDYSSYLFAITISATSFGDSTNFVWSANRDYPVQENAIMNFTAAGDLVLKDGDGSIVWTTNTAGKSVVGMNLTDTGNLVLFNDQNSVVWQSFDHPTDCLLPGQKLYQGQKLKSSVSLTESGQEGMYSLQVMEKGVFVYVESNPPIAYYSIFDYPYVNDTNKGRKYIRFLNGSLSVFIHSSEPSDPDDVISIPEASSAQVMKLMPDGHLKVFEWQLNEWKWKEWQLNEWKWKAIKNLTTVGSYPTANLSTTWTARYSAIQPTLLRKTKVVQFSCGFLCEGNCKGVSKSFNYIFAIFISLATDPGEYRVVWSANRYYPVRNNAMLNFTAAGELVLQDADGSIVWTTNTAGKSVAGMNLTDTGNLVLFDDQNLVVWQSFDHPTNCLLPGQKLFQGQKLTSGVSSNNPGQEGMYSLQVTDKGLLAYLESDPPQPYFRIFVEGHNANNRRRYIKLLNGSLAFFVDSSEPSDILDGAINIPQASSAQYMTLLPDGHLKVFEWQSSSREWAVVTDITAGFVHGCSYPLMCGRNSICLTNQQCICHSSEYFRPVNDRQPNLGCSEITPLSCNSTQDQDFIKLENVMYFTPFPDMEGVNMETCKQACLNNCSCKAAFFQYYSNASDGNCFLPSEIFTMEAADAFYHASAFIKVQNVTSHRLSHQVARVAGATIGGFMVLLVVALCFIKYVGHKPKRDAEMEEECLLDQFPGMLIRFSYEELINATENFSKKLGEGGFGSVFEGSLKDGSKIAVKCLEGLAHVKKSFLAEVQSIGSIHHVNLVRLRGFCTWKSHNFLVYDFMSNGSLDKWIYHGNRDHILEWECRKKVILDIAKGLAYLHEDCRQRIVHLDIKPQNILLDDDFNAKVSDFGLSKLIDKDQTEVMTNIKGTPGYIAPEWRSSIITEKLDVYSFGIVLLEILCGRKIFDRSLPEESWYLLFVFQKCWEQGTLFDMVDRHSEDMQVHKTEVMEMMKVAAWCLQTNFKRRPSMSMVVKVLEGVKNVESNLDYNFTDPRIQEPVVGNEKDFTLLPSSLLSGPR